MARLRDDELVLFADRLPIMREGGQVAAVEGVDDARIPRFKEALEALGGGRGRQGCDEVVLARGGGGKEYERQDRGQSKVILNSVQDRGQDATTRC